ncbi:MAG: RNA polymerase sigma factor [uncultured Thiotrichaceae bacterium]|uniref:RNA polymerase sigma factor n=1 Tax=uncultured Thiotrichaceae bacterium TaxID=298394 RepID=A0A6S6TYI5_9GAMM|nr:MAG: RNA polymerase sigma factor [uncultured Thiotrichaceae bacterium]
MIFPRKRRFRQQLEVLQPVLFKLAWSWCHDQELANDLVQDTCQVALKKYQHLQDLSKAKPWLVRILANLHIDHCRRQKDIIPFNDEYPTQGNDPAELNGRLDDIECVRRAIANLHHDHRKIITLVDLAECSYAEVADILDIPVGTVMSRLSRARTQLRSTLESSHYKPMLRSVK